MKRTHYALITIVALAIGTLAAGCQKEDDIRPIDYQDSSESNDNGLEGSIWTYHCESTLAYSDIAFKIMSVIDFSTIDKGTFRLSTDLMSINTDCSMSYTLHDGQGSITLDNWAGGQAVVSFELLDSDHLRVTLTPAVALQDSAYLAIIMNGFGGTWEAVYSRWDAGTAIAELYGSSWVTEHSMGDFIMEADGAYCNINIVSRIDFDNAGGGTMNIFYDGNWGETTFATADTLRKHFMAHYNGVELRLLFDDMSEAVLTRAVVNNDPVLMMSASAEVFEMEGDAANLPDILATLGKNRMLFNRPADMEDDKGMGELQIPGETIGLYLMEQYRRGASRTSYVIRGEEDLFISMLLNAGFEAGSYTIGGGNIAYIYFSNNIYILSEGNIDITNIAGGYRVDCSGKSQGGESITFYYQGPLNDYETITMLE